MEFLGLYLARPLYLVLLLPLVAWVLWYALRYHPRRLRVDWPIRPGIQVGANQLARLLALLPPALVALALAALVMALARPQSRSPLTDLARPGLDVLLALDISRSMAHPDVPASAVDAGAKPTAAPLSRLGAAQAWASAIVAARPTDRLGLLIFSEAALLYAPLSHDPHFLRQRLGELSPQLLPAEGTALGTAIGMGISQLGRATGSGQVLVVLTDGAGNRGLLGTRSAAALCAQAGIRLVILQAGEPESARLAPEWATDTGVLADAAQTAAGLLLRPVHQPDWLRQLNQTLDTIPQRRTALPDSDDLGFTRYVVREHYGRWVLAALLLLTLAGLLRAARWANLLEG
jgi:Ca-activated chloride channel family protein